MPRRRSGDAASQALNELRRALAGNDLNEAAATAERAAADGRVPPEDVDGLATGLMEAFLASSDQSGFIGVLTAHPAAAIWVAAVALDEGHPAVALESAWLSSSFCQAGDPGKVPDAIAMAYAKKYMCMLYAC